MRVITRRKINQFGLEHDTKFVFFEDIEKALVDILVAAELAGADMDELHKHMLGDKK